MTISFGTSLATPATASSSAEGAHRIAIANDRELRQLAASDPKSGTPQYAAIYPVMSDGTGRQRLEVLFYPTPDADMTVEYRSSITPHMLSEDRPYPLGGRQYSELLLQSCLAVAEQREKGVEGVATGRFLERLAAAVQLDIQSLAASADGVWPVDESPETLEIDRKYLERLLGRRLGHGPSSKSWTHQQASEVDEAIRTGLRRFYTPAVLPGERYAHQWSFLRPIATLNTLAGVEAYDLPDDFAMLDGPLSFRDDDSVFWAPLSVVSEHMLRSNRQRVASESRPSIAAIRVKPPIDGRTRWELLLWPTPDDVYAIEYRYKTNPGLLAEGSSMPVGGMPHAQTVIESCLWAADDLRGEKNSPHRAAYLERLASSVSHDRLTNAPDTLGRNYDASDDECVGDYRDYMSHVVTYNGVEY